MRPESAATLPTFRTSRLTLRQRDMGDLHACLAMDRDPLVTRFVRGPWEDPAAHRAFVEERIRHAYPPGMGYWSILAPSFIGWILLTPLDLHGPEIEMGWRLIRKAWVMATRRRPRGRCWITRFANSLWGASLLTSIRTIRLR